jgi:FkbM family methyltransferase
MKRTPSKQSFLKHLRLLNYEPEIVVDVGVHQYGTSDLINELGSAYHILIEPVREFAEAIRTLYSGCGIQYKLLSIGLAEHAGIMMLAARSITDDPSEISHSHLKGELKFGETRDHISEYAVDVKTLEWIIEMHPEIKSSKSLLKLDVDGLELEILKGAKSSLQYFDLILIEMPIRFYKNRFLYLLSNGFSLLDIVDPTYYMGFLSQVDMVFASERLLMSRPDFEPWGNRPFVWDDYHHWTDISDSERNP